MTAAAWHRARAAAPRNPYRGRCSGPAEKARSSLLAALDVATRVPNPLDTYEEFRRAMADFPAPPTIQDAYAKGARTLIVHYGDYPVADRDTLRRNISNAPGLEEVATFGLDVVYKIRSGS